MSSKFVQKTLKAKVNSDKKDLWKYGASSKVDLYKSCEDQFEYLEKNFNINYTNIYNSKEDKDKFIGFASLNLLKELSKDKELLEKKNQFIKDEIEKKIKKLQELKLKKFNIFR